MYPFEDVPNMRSMMEGMFSAPTYARGLPSPAEVKDWQRWLIYLSRHDPSPLPSARSDSSDESTHDSDKSLPVSDESPRVAETSPNTTLRNWASVAANNILPVTQNRPQPSTPPNHQALGSGDMVTKNNLANSTNWCADPAKAAALRGPWRRPENGSPGSLSHLSPSSDQRLSGPKVFEPTAMVLENKGLIPTQTGTRYKGDTTSKSYLCQLEDLPDAESCALWIRNIEPEVGYPELFDLIHVGTVFALDIKPPVLGKPLCAARLAFLTPEAAAAFKNSDIWLRGRLLRVVYDRHPRPRDTRNISRVLMIEGPTNIMNRFYWNSYFDKYCLFTLERVVDHLCYTPGRAIMEFRFIRVDGQAQCCFDAIRNDTSLPAVKVSYGRDPCNPSGRV